MSDAPNPVDHRTACMQMLLWFAEQGKTRRQGNQSPEVVTTQSAMASAYPPLSDSALAKALNAGAPETSLDGWIYGPETGHSGSRSVPEVVPAITASWSWKNVSPRMQVLIALILAGRDAQTGLSATAFRFESGEIGTIHDFHHAQPTARITHRGDYLTGIIPPFHESVPAFPLDATGPVGIVACALLSLYGRGWIEPMLIENPYLRTYVLTQLGELPAFSTMIARRPAASSSSAEGDESATSGTTAEATRGSAVKQGKQGRRNRKRS